MTEQLPADLSKALMEKVVAVGGALGLSIAFPDVTFTVPDKPERYLEVTHFRNDAQSPMWDESSVYSGILQIGLVSYMQQGELPELEICGKIAKAFRKNTVLNYGEAVVRISASPSILSVLQDGHKATYPVSIPYRTSGLT